METVFIDEPQLELRKNGEQHVMSVRCVPYGTVTTKAGPRPERFRAGAFASAPSAAAKVRLTDENHSKDRRPVGIAQRLVDRPGELYGEFRFYNTPEGRAALENVAEGTYGGVSVGFIAVDEDVVDGVREIRAAQLHHVSLVDTPAYDDAEILDLRNAATDYEWLRVKPQLQLPDDEDDTPMLIRARRMLGNLRAGA